MIAHRGGYNLDFITENSLSNIYYTIQNYKNMPIEIDLYFHNSQIYIGHDLHLSLLNQLTLKTLLHSFHLQFTHLYLDIKTDNSPCIDSFIKTLMNILALYPSLKISIHSDNYHLLKLLYSTYEFKQIGIIIEKIKDIHFMQNPIFVYYVLPIAFIEYSTFIQYSIYWFTFSTNLDWYSFKNKYRLPEYHNSFIDILL
jgi:hypothetical protein